MPALQIRDLPPDLYEALSTKAREEGRSLAQQAIVELRLSLRSRDHAATREATLRELAEGAPLVDLPVETLLADLQADRKR